MTKQQQQDDPRSVWNTTAPDEPVFILRAQDRYGPRIVQRWIEATAGVATAEQRFEADQIRLAMLQWQIERGATGLSLEPIVPLPDPNRPLMRDKVLTVKGKSSELHLSLAKLREAHAIHSIDNGTAQATFSIVLYFPAGAPIVLNFDAQAERDTVLRSILDVLQPGL
jgi:hypothetical protein